MRKATFLALALLLAAGAAFAANELIVTEIMYNSTEADDVEWIELYNNSGATLDLTGWYVLDDNLTHTQMALSGTMAPGAVMLLVGTETLFTAKYPGVTNYFPVFFQQEGATWALGNGGDAVNVFNAAAELVFSVTFDDAAPWPTAPDGTGPSLLLVSNNYGDFNDASSWTVGVTDGTPGVLTQTVGNEDLSWGLVKGLYR
ncbi:MAG: lamin tail domain-containing protein [bacterium]|nr:lamin tail domain-containing protein [bacterium]